MAQTCKAAYASLAVIDAWAGEWDVAAVAREQWNAPGDHGARKHDCSPLTHEQLLRWGIGAGGYDGGAAAPPR